MLAGEDTVGVAAAVVVGPVGGGGGVPVPPGGQDPPQPGVALVGQGQQRGHVRAVTGHYAAAGRGGRYLIDACYGRADATKVSYEGALKPVRDRLGRRKLQSLTRADIEDLRDWMTASGRRRGGTPGAPLGARSVQLTLGRLKAALEMACQEGWLARNPAEYVRPPRRPSGRARRGRRPSCARSSPRQARTGWPRAGG